MTADPHNLQRYVAAQDRMYARVCAELTAGAKQTHWMWFIFPQLEGLGSSPTARTYAIRSAGEARAYLAHALLGERLRTCTAIVNGLTGRTVEQIFGYPDHLKFHSCVTLFAYAAGERLLPGGGVGAADPAGVHAARVGDAARPAGKGVFGEALARYFAGEEDPLTRRLLSAAS